MGYNASKTRYDKLAFFRILRSIAWYKTISRQHSYRIIRWKYRKLNRHGYTSINYTESSIRGIQRAVLILCMEKMYSRYVRNVCKNSSTLEQFEGRIFQILFA